MIYQINDDGFGVSKPVSSPTGDENSIDDALRDLIRLVVAELPDFGVAPNAIISSLRQKYPNAQVMFVAAQAQPMTPGVRPEAEAPEVPGAISLATGDALRQSLHAIARTPASAAAHSAAPKATDPEPTDAVRRLPQRQVEVARHLVHGLSNKGIAREMDLSESTVKVYVVSIFRVLGVHSRAAAISKILGTPELKRDLGL